MAALIYPLPIPNMFNKTTLLLLLGCISICSADTAFERQAIDSKVLVGYGLAIGDVDGDGKKDILIADKYHFSWYHNPTWEEHVLTRNLTLRDNVCIAAQDIDGDGKVEIAVGARWNPGNTLEPMASGSVHYLARPKKNVTDRWRPVELFHEPTVHRMRWVAGADNRYRLVVLPLHGIGNKNGKGENGVNVRAYLPDLKWVSQSRGWTHEVIDDDLHMTHNFDNDKGDLYIGGAEGIVRRHISDKSDRDARIITPENSEPPTRGVGEVRKGNDFIAAIEPIHGTDLVVYKKAEGVEKWRRTLLTDQLKEGHALAVADIMGDAKQEIVVGWRKPNAAKELGIKIFSQDEAGNWTGAWIDKEDMATEDLKVADLDGDGKLEIIAAGRKSQNLVIYWNRSE